MNRLLSVFGLTTEQKCILFFYFFWCFFRATSPRFKTFTCTEDLECFVFKIFISSLFIDCYIVYSTL